MLMTPLGGRGVGPAWQQESLMLVLKIPADSSFHQIMLIGIYLVKM